MPSSSDGRPLRSDLATSRITRRHFVVGGLAASLLAAAACGGDDGESASTVPSTPSPTTAMPTTVPTPTTAADAPAAFPVAIDHAFGTTTLDAAPQRIVVVGFKEQDYFLALGVVPVAIREWFGQQPSATWPWAQTYLQGQQPEVLPRAELDYEQILALQPDLIVGLSSGMGQEDYDQLVLIAPTIAQPSVAGDFSVTWQDMTRRVGAILGKSEEAERLVVDLEQRIVATAAEHPELQGASTILASAVGGELYLYGPDATAALVLGELGLAMSDEVAQLTDNADAYYVVSPERFDLFDVDVAVWSEAATDEGPQALLASAIYQNLTVAKERREVFLGELNGAMVFSSVLSLPMVLDEVVPQLALAIDGDPATVSTLGA